MSSTYLVHGRYYGGEKFKYEVYEAISAPGAVSLVMSKIPQVRVAFAGVKETKSGD